jgi:oligoribonuclease (3'-5' exoribonuclease)
MPMKKWDLEHKDFLLEYLKKYRKEHPEYVAREKVRTDKRYLYKKESLRLRRILMTD